MHEISIKAEELFRIGSFSVTNSLLLALVCGALFLIFALVLKFRMSIVPGFLQGVFEIVLEEILKLMETVFGSRLKAEKYLPLIATIFLFVVVSNWLGLFPFVGSLGLYEYADGHEKFVPLFRAPSADLNFTIALALIAVLSIHILGAVVLGIRTYASKFFTIKSPLLFLVGVLEFILEFVKIISLSFRLFGNVFAGEALLIIVGFLVPYVVPMPFLFIEIFVGFMQAFIFAMLTLVFVAMAASREAH